MGEFVAAAAAGVTVYSESKAKIWDPVWSKIDLSKNIKTIHRYLNDEMEKLCAKRDDYKEKLQRERATKRPSKSYNSWIDRFTRIEGEVKELNSTFEKKCRISRLRVYARSEFCEKMIQKISDVAKLYEEAKELEEILVEKEPECVIRMIAPDIKEYSTLQKSLEQILDFLANKNFKCIGVHGQIGTGKTTIMQNLNNHEKVAEMFEIVIWVNVSTAGRNLSMEEMQHTIVRRLKLNIEGSDRIDEVANRIKDELKDRKYLLLLDDVRTYLHLDQIGIDPDNKNGSKIVLTTTVDSVCRSMVDRVIKVEKLGNKDALKMFKNVLGYSQLENEREIERFIVQILKICDGLPLVLKAVASDFKVRKTMQRWSDGLNILRKGPEKGDSPLKRLYELLNFRTDELDSAQKKCFLYSAIYPEDSDIRTDCLLDCWAAENLYDSSDDSELTRVYYRDILDHLTTVSLLEECVRTEYVRMHKMIRKAALYKLSNDDELEHLVETGKSLREPPNVEHWKHKNWISLGVNKLQALPELSDSLIVSTLLLQENPRLKKFPDSFFEHMGTLRVLNLYCTGVASLPSSLSKLIRLKVLYLNSCTSLVELPSQIGELEDLEVLDISGSGVQNIPPDMEKLGQLRRLLVSFTNMGNKSDIDTVLHNCQVISKICSLEELVIDVNSINQFYNEMLNAVTNELAATLTRLTTLKFCFKDGDEDHVIKKGGDTLTFRVPTVEAFTGFIQRIDDLDSFLVFIGCSISSSSQISKSYEYERYLRYCGGEGCNPTISKVLARIDAFELVNHIDLQHVSQFGTESMNKVQACLVEGCHRITTIVDGSNCTVDGSSILPNLKRLYIKNLPNLTRVCAYGWLAASLEELEIHGCPNLIELPFNKDNAMKLRSIKTDSSLWDTLQWQDPTVKERLSALLC